MASTINATTQGVLAEASVPPSEHVSTEENVYLKGVVIGEFSPVFAEIPTPQKGVIPTRASQTKSIYPATPPVISASDPFVAFS